MSDAPDLQLTDWVCKVTDDKTVRLGDIPGVDWDPLCIELDKTWYQLASAPLYGTGRQTQGIFDLCAARVGEPTHELTSNEMWDRFEHVKDDRPTMHDKSGLPLPKAEDAQATTG